MRKKVGFISAVLGLILMLYLFLGLLGFVPLVGYQFLGETLVRFIAQCAISCFLIASWGYWTI